MLVDGATEMVTIGVDTAWVLKWSFVFASRAITHNSVWLGEDALTRSRIIIAGVNCIFFLQYPCGAGAWLILRMLSR